MENKKPAGPTVERIPEGDDRPRMTCLDCGFIRYDNPKIVVGAICTWEDRILMCKRAIEPRIGYWTIPAGYLELNETAAEGAAREVKEEACATVEIDRLLGVYEIPRISHVYMIYGATLHEPKYAPGYESLDVALLGWDDIPWDELAFPSITWALERYREGIDDVLSAVHTR
jgi:ADP-ribose pyrophosphatase YjhB (NUDIX family)